MTFREDDSCAGRSPVSDDTQKILPLDLDHLADPNNLEELKGYSVERLRAVSLRIQMALTGHLPETRAVLATNVRLLIETILGAKLRKK